MAYRLLEVRMVVGDDSSLAQIAFDRDAVLTQTKDLEVAPATIRVAPTDAEAQISLGTITTGYALGLFSDYPILVRLNGSNATQFTLTSNSPPVTNVGAPAPPTCFFATTAQVTSLRVAPIANAAQTATVWLCCVGDPLSAYI